MKRLLPPVAACLALTGVPALAHPHIFVETGLRFVVDDAGLLTGVEIAWAYDEMYSMLVLDDLQLDPEYDGILTDAEVGKLAGFDLNWIEGFEGDFYITSDGAPVELAAPEGRGAEFDGAKVITRHWRALVTPIPAKGLVAKAYDPGFYTAYDLSRGVEIDGDCMPRVTAPDSDDAYRKMQKHLASLPPDAEDYPQVGEMFAETVTLDCEARS